MANILEDVQAYVAERLNSDAELSGKVEFLVENRKSIDFEIKSALGKQGIVGLVLTPKASYQGKFEDQFLAWQLDELEVDIVENPTVNRGTEGSITGQDAAMRAFQVLCPTEGGETGKFSPVTYEQGEDSGLLVNRCVFRTLVYGDHQDSPTPSPGITYKIVKLLDDPPPPGVQPQDGWMWIDSSGNAWVCDSGNVVPLGGAVSAIEDDRGNVINADLTGRHVTDTYVWHIASVGGEAADLTGTYEHAEFFPSNPSDYDYGYTLDVREGSGTAQGSNDFQLIQYIWLDGTWVGDSGGTAGEIPVGATHYADAQWTADWGARIEDVTLATTTYVDNIVGEIDSVLDAINGEVI